MCKHFYDTEVVLVIAHSANADRPFVRTPGAVCASWQADLAALRHRAKARVGVLSNTPTPL